MTVSDLLLVSHFRYDNPNDYCVSNILTVILWWLLMQCNVYVHVVHLMTWYIDHYVTLDSFTLKPVKYIQYSLHWNLQMLLFDKYIIRYFILMTDDEVTWYPFLMMMISDILSDISSEMIPLIYLCRYRYSCSIVFTAVLVVRCIQCG
jgi:hypothetical protein